MPTTTIQKTSKWWKFMQLVGDVALICGLIMGMNDDARWQMVTGSGVTLLLLAKAGAWWDHG